MSDYFQRVGKSLKLLENHQFMRKPAEWMTPLDDRILEALNAGLVLSPAIIAYNIEKSREAVSRRLSELADRGLVTRVERGKYEITDSGRAYLKGELDVDKLEDAAK